MKKYTLIRAIGLAIAGLLGHAISAAISVSATAATTSASSEILQTKPYWQAIAANEYRIPEHADAMVLMRTLVTFSALPDPNSKHEYWRGSSMFFAPNGSLDQAFTF